MNHFNFHFRIVLLLAIISCAKLQPSVSPINSVFPIGSEAVFTCVTSDATTYYSSWIVNSPDGPFDTYDEATLLQSKGIFLEKNNTHLVLSVLASLENNGTSFYCREIHVDGPLFSDEIILIAIGPPSAPPLTVITTVDYLLFQWEAPFSWPGYDIVTYHIRVDGPDGVESFNTMQLEHSYTTPSAVPTHCTPVTFEVMAVSELESGEAATVITGWPIVPGEFGSTTSLVQFAQNGIPEVTVTLEPPGVCEYETADLVLELSLPASDGGRLVSVLSRQYSSSLEEIVVTFNNGLETNRTYIVEMTARSAAGSSSTTFEFNTYSAELSPTDSDTVPISGLYIGLLSSAVLCVVVVLILTVLVILFSAKRRGNNRTEECHAEEHHVHKETKSSKA